MNQPLTGKVAIVTGSGRGIGQAIAMKLARHGCAVVVNDLDADAGEATTADIRGAGGQSFCVPGSITDPAMAPLLVDAAVGGFGGVDIIVNNAGYTWDGVLQRMTDEQWSAMLDVHLTAPFRLLRAAQPVIADAVRQARAAGGPVPCRKVVNVSSIAGLGGNAGQANYAAAKAGVVGLTKALAKEWGRYNVTVNAVAYGLIRTRLTDAPADAGSSIDISGRQIRVGVNPDLLTQMEASIPLGRAGTPEDAAGAAYLLCVPESDYVSGQVLVCGGGFMI